MSIAGALPPYSHYEEEVWHRRPRTVSCLRVDEVRMVALGEGEPPAFSNRGTRAWTVLQILSDSRIMQPISRYGRAIHWKEDYDQVQ